MLEQAGAETRFDCQGRNGVNVALFPAGGDSGVPAGLPLLGAVISDCQCSTKQQQHQQHDANQQALERAHAASRCTSYWAIFRRRITAISLSAYAGSVA